MAQGSLSCLDNGLRVGGARPILDAWLTVRAEAHAARAAVPHVHERAGCVRECQGPNTILCAGGPGIAGCRKPRVCLQHTATNSTELTISWSTFVQHCAQLRNCQQS
jgi:hypothetical protein